MTVVTLELPQRIYQEAAQIAKATKRPIEQVVVEWIRPPIERAGSVQEAVLAGLEAMSTAQLTQVARSGAAPEDTDRLRQLLSLQEQRELTQAEHDEAVRLVEQEDLITLRKAKAIYLLKQRNALSDDLAALLS
jgi:predicted transcriptional regulator